MHGHVNPTLAVARELTSRGHAVTYHLPDAFAAAVLATGAKLSAYEAPPRAPESAAADPMAIAVKLPFQMTAAARAILPQVLPALRRERPDLLIYDALSVWGRMAAELLPVRAAMVWASYAINSEFSYLSGGAGLGGVDFDDAIDGFASDMHALSTVFGTPRLDLHGLFNHSEPLTLVFVPRALQPACETFDEERYTLERFQKRPVEWMETMDWLGDDVWFAHAIHVNDDEIREFARTGAGVAHCPCSNMRLASGIAPVKKYLDAGVRVGLGVDGSASNDASNILLEALQAMLLARLRIGLLPPEGPQTLLSTSDPLRRSEWMTAREALEIATRGGAAVLGRSDIGALAPGMCADFFSIDLNTVDYAGALNDPVAATVFCAPQKARHTVINGRVVVENWQVTTVDMAPVIEAHNRFSRGLASAQLASSP